MGMARRFLVLHGWQNHRPPEHWQHWLVERLRARGEQVLYPQLPSPDDPLLDDWLDVLRGELRQLGGGERVVIAHSLGCLLWLRHAALGGDAQPVDRLLLVCPPSTSTLPAELATFFPGADDGAALARSVLRRPELVCTDADTWCPEGAAATYGDALDLDVHTIPGGGHLDIAAGYGAFPAAEQWALTGTFPTAAAPAREGRLERVERAAA